MIKDKLPKLKQEEKQEQVNIEELNIDKTKQRRKVYSFVNNSSYSAEKFQH